MVKLDLFVETEEGLTPAEVDADRKVTPGPLIARSRRGST